MFFKFLISLAAFALYVQMVVATPPACVLEAVQEQLKPGEVVAVCKNATAIQQFLSSNCGQFVDHAMRALSSTCLEAAVTVSTLSASSSAKSATAGAGAGSVSPSASSVAHSSNKESSAASTLASHTETAVGSTAAIITGTQTSSPSAATSWGAASTGAAGRMQIDELALGAVAAAGILIAL